MRNIIEKWWENTICKIWSGSHMTPVSRRSNSKNQNCAELSIYELILILFWHCTCSRKPRKQKKTLHSFVLEKKLCSLEKNTLPYFFYLGWRNRESQRRGVQRIPIFPTKIDVHWNACTLRPSHSSSQFIELSKKKNISSTIKKIRTPLIYSKK